MIKINKNKKKKKKDENNENDVFPSLALSARTKSNNSSSQLQLHSPVQLQSPSLQLTENDIEKMKNEIMHRFDDQILAIRSGLATIIPLSTLSLLNGGDLELLVTGPKVIDVNLLKHNTNYSGYNAKDNVIVYFWNIMEKRFTHDEISKLLIFVWGRSKLPKNTEEFTQKFTISKPYTSTFDNSLPIGKTCSFTLQLPPYSNENIMYQKLLYAITNCTAYDLDGGYVMRDYELS